MEQRERAMEALDRAITGDADERRRFVELFVDAILERPATPHAQAVQQEIHKPGSDLPAHQPTRLDLGL